MQRTMRAAVVRAFGQPLSIEEVPVPVPSAGEVLVRVVASGVCHTDLHAANGDWPVKPALPFIPGHEGVGYVAALGAGVTTLKEGDRVGVPWLHNACGACDPCITGWETLCPSQQNTGYSVNGGHAEYVVAPAAYVGRIPDALGFVDAAPILCAGVTSYKGLKETEARPGQWVVVSGIGGLGHLAIPYAKAMGLRVVAVDVGADKLDLARELGAEIAIDALHVDPAAEVQKQIGGAHGALVTAVSPGAFRQALGTLRSGGTCVLVGLPPGDFPTPIFDVVLKRLTLRGSIVGTRMDLKEALEIAAHDKIRPTTEVQPLEAINSVFARMAEGTIHGRVVLALREEEKGPG
ncbi:alcohol dehydrogenase AdhP [Polyangium jinanense]|uniref:alcohol dehydrogenase n=1 Tax=Polyangium jinanense TaxID=2829994 RepID=A0A9X4AVK4_9BACT|nr:alcohol dehydrogenase AdhP [Polyangium jinanense]MDC3956003.1 alcohol dehydrogenase AdhP [Polyangium jinanense]MDC3961490.1 alcohol dehydrogenase AdhP [Polyangium jinanense]MDC3986363.1 alcohol dehydrogenase AdhP [Polyangium jinanense]